MDGADPSCLVGDTIRIGDGWIVKRQRAGHYTEWRYTKDI